VPAGFAAPNNSVNVSPYLLKAQRLKLANHPYWHKLLHYQERSSGVVGDVITPEFYISPKGSTDSEAELAATIKAIFSRTNIESDLHAQCRFIARFHWLKQMLQWPVDSFPKAPCQRFNEWSLNGDIESLSVIFATGYLDNPASFYGHLLIKFNTRRQMAVSDLLDQSINYGAVIPDNENGLVYVIKGLFGGYDAGFSTSRFYQHNHNYAESELRDLWEYKLNLSQDEVDQIVYHAWELFDNKFTYYFVADNCAFRMAELLNLVVKEPLLPPDLPWSMPGTVFNKIVEAEHTGRPLVAQVTRIPSRQNRFRQSFLVLSVEQQAIVEELLQNDLDFDLQSYARLSEQDKINVVDCLIDYNEFRRIATESNPEFKKTKQKLLIERIRLPAQFPNIGTANVAAVSPMAPHNGQRPVLFRSGLLHNSEFGTGMELQFRPVYFDFLAIDAGRLENAHLTMLDGRVMFESGKVRLRQLDFVNVETLNVSKTGLPGDGGMAWKMKVSIESLHLGCSTCQIFGVTGGIGKAFSPLDNTAIYAMVDGHLQTDEQNAGTVAATPRLGFLGVVMKGWKTKFDIGYKQYFNKSETGDRKITWENRFGTSRYWDIRLSFNEYVAKEVKIALSLYW
jgi:hypothetical protein